MKSDRTIEAKTIWATMEYDQFSYSVINRPIDRDKVARMVMSMTEKGNWLEDYPIVVQENGVVLDGQHRLEVARTLGVPIFFIISDMQIGQVAEAARNTDKWTTRDYLHFYSSQGGEDYVWLREFLERHPHVGLAVVLTTTREYRERVYDAFRGGALRIDDDKKELLERMAGLSLVLKDYVPALYGRATFQRALAILLKHEGFDQDRLLSQWRNSGLNVYRQATAIDYVRVLGQIYNYKYSVNRVNFLEGRLRSEF